jgi:TP901 family phage tail tape measure protein
MASLGELFVTVGANVGGFKQAMTDVKASVGEVNGVLDKQILGAFTAVGAAAIAAGVAIDDAFDDIRISTGETGKNLKGLEDSFVNIFSTLPVSSEAASTAIADLNTRLGLTGPALESMATQMLNLARMTNTEVGPIIQSVTRVFGDWDVAAEDTAKTLDYLFRTSQSTGISVTQLSTSLVQFGAPLRQMGFDLGTSAALLGKFEQEGVNTELVMGSMRIALTRMAREGITDASAGLLEVQQRIKDAGSAGEANKIAMEAFGAKAGPDMAAAIREGRFELGELLTQLQDGKETINGAAAATDGFKEDLTNLKNTTTLALEPLGTGLMSVLTSLMTALKPVSAGFRDMQEEVGKLDSKTKLAATALSLMYPMLITTFQALGVGKKSAEDYNTANEKVQKSMGAVGTAHAKAAPKITSVGTGMKAAEKSAKALEAAYSKLGLKDLQEEAEDLGKAINKLKDSGDWNKLSVDQQKSAMDKYEQAAFKASGKTYDFSREILNLSLQFKNAFTPAEALRMELDGMSTEMQALSSDIRNLPMGTLNADMMRQSQITAEAAGKVITLQDAYSKLGITAKADLDKVAQEAAEARDAVLGSGTATDFEKRTAIYKALKAQVEAAIAAGETIPAEQAKLFKKMEEDLSGSNGLAKIRSQWDTLADDIKGTIGNASRAMIDSMWEGDFSFGKIGMQLLKDLGKSVTDAFIKPAVDAISGFITNTLEGLLKPALDKAQDWFGSLGKSAADAFGGGAADAAGGAAGPSGGGGGGGGSDAGGAMGAIGAIAGVISAVSDVIANFQMYAINKSLDLIEKSTRYTDINIGNLLPKLTNDFAAELPQIHERLKEFRTYGIGVWPQDGYSWTLAVDSLVSIADATTSTVTELEAIGGDIADSVDATIGSVAAETDQRVRDAARDADARVRDTTRDAEERFRFTAADADQRTRDAARDADGRVRDSARDADQRVRDVARDADARVRDATRTSGAGSLRQSFLRSFIEPIEDLAEAAAAGPTMSFTESKIEAMAQSLLVIQLAIENVISNTLKAIHGRLTELRIFGIGTYAQPGMENGIWNPESMREWGKVVAGTFLPDAAMRSLMGPTGAAGTNIYIDGNVIGNHEFVKELAGLVAAELSLQGAN